MPRRKKESGGEHHASSERWLVSYADFITLMFVVFAVLFSMARLDLSKFNQLAASFNANNGPAGPDIAPFQAEAQSGRPMGVMPPERPGVSLDYPSDLIDPSTALSLQRFNRDPAAIEPPTPDQPATPPKTTVTNTPQGNSETPAPKPPSPVEVLADAVRTSNPNVKVTLSDLNLAITYEGSVLFDPQSATLKPAATSQLDDIVAKMKAAKVVQPVMITCVADENPTGSTADAMDLAASRAAAVTRYLRKAAGMDQVTFQSSAVVPPANPNRKPAYEVSIVILRNAQ